MSTGGIFRCKAFSTPVARLEKWHNVAAASSADVASELKVLIQHFLQRVMQPLYLTLPMPLGSTSKKFDKLLMSSELNGSLSSTPVSKIKRVH